MKNSPEANSKKRSRKKLPQAFTIVSVNEKFKGRCFFVDRHGIIICHCDIRYKVNMDTDGLNSHVNTGIHKKWEARRDEEQHRQAHIEEVVDADNGNLHHESHVSEKYKAFHIQYVQNMMV
jgi:hypothetical protein